MGERTEDRDALFFLVDEPLDPEDGGNPIVRRLATRLRDKTMRIPGAAAGGSAESRFNPGNKPFKGPFTCAIYGPWGSGKTSLLKALEHEFRVNESVTVWFEPWRYENEQQLLVPLLVEFQARIQHTIRNDNLKRAALETGKRLMGRIAKGVIRTAATATKAHIGVDLYEIGEEFLKQYGEMRGDWSETLSEVQEFKSDFRDLISLASTRAYRNPDVAAKRATARARREGRIPVAIFIDDLDRCNPEQVRRLLEAIKLFLHEPGVFFFLGLDEEQVLQAMAEPYRQYFPESTNAQLLANSLAKRYLEKFFQYAVDVGDASSPLHESVVDLRRGLWAAIKEFVPAEKRPDVEVVFGAVKANPRALSRAARWLYFESDLVGAHDLLPRFAEHVLSINWEVMWVELFMGESIEARQNCYRACSRLMEDLDFRNRAEDALVMLQARIGLLGSELALGTLEDESPWSDDFESQYVLSHYTPLTEHLSALVARRKPSELDGLRTVFLAARERPREY